MRASCFTHSLYLNIIFFKFQLDGWKSHEVTGFVETHWTTFKETGKNAQNPVMKVDKKIVRHCVEG